LGTESGLQDAEERFFSPNKMYQYLFIDVQFYFKHSIIKKGTFEEAQFLCSSIGTRSLSVEYDDKDACVAKLVGSKKKVHEIYTIKI